MDDPTSGLINPDAFTPEIKRGLRFKGSEAQSAGFIADSDKIRDTINLIDPNKKMFEQPRAVRELAELPSVKSFLDFHTGADGIRQFDTTFRGDYLLDVLKERVLNHKNLKQAAKLHHYLLKNYSLLKMQRLVLKKLVPL